VARQVARRVAPLARALARALLARAATVCVRTEGLHISGSLFRNKVILMRQFNKRHNTNPKRGPFHFRAPSKMLYRVIRGMLKHKTSRGQAALARLKVYEGCPHPYDRMKKQVIPQALKTLRLKPNRAFCTLGDLASKMGWKHQELIGRLEGNRLTKAAAWYQAQKQLTKLKTQAKATVTAEVAGGAELKGLRSAGKGVKAAASNKAPAAVEESDGDM